MNSPGGETAAGVGEQKEHQPITEAEYERAALYEEEDRARQRASFGAFRAVHTPQGIDWVEDDELYRASRDEERR